MIREYFSHDYNARNDKKLVKLFMKHGLAGIGAFWCLIEMLYESNGKIMRSECERIAFEMRTTCEFIDSIITDFDLFECDENAFWSISVNNRLFMRSEKSEKAKASAKARWSAKNDDANALRTQCDGNANKGKESKVNKKESIYSFENFWNAYSKKTDKTKCINKWSKLTEEEKKLAMDVIEKYVKSTPDVSFRKNPLTWLNGKCWEDEITIYQQPSQPTSQPRNPKIVTQTGYNGFKFD